MLWLDKEKNGDMGEGVSMCRVGVGVGGARKGMGEEGATKSRGADWSRLAWFGGVVAVVKCGEVWCVMAVTVGKG